jgi:hypothetical protein
MPKGVTEISQGNQFSRSANEGQLADSATRTFRVLLNSPSEVFDIQASCGVFVGDPHPTNPNIYCASFDAKYEGDTRMVLVATFNYQSAATASDSGGGGGGGGGGGSKTISPEIRPANWSLSTELTEVPLRMWRFRTGIDEWSPSSSTPRNPVGDMYEGLTKLMPMTTIKVTQFVLGGAGDPTAHAYFVGEINDDTIQLGNIVAQPHTLMLRSLSATPAVESYGRLVFRGWTTEYTFLLRNDFVSVSFDLTGEANTSTTINIGWDAAIIVEGRNVTAFNPAAAAAWQDPFGQPLKAGPDGAALDPNNLALPTGVAAGSRQRAHVGITGFSDRGMSQSPAGEPIALNLDGTPRKISGSRGPIIRAYQIYDSIPMVETLRLRLF